VKFIKLVWQDSGEAFFLRIDCIIDVANKGRSTVVSTATDEYEVRDSVMEIISRLGAEVI